VKLTYELHDSSATKSTITIDAPNITGAEQNLVLLDEELKPIAVLELQPGIDRRQL
jgi:hypothetical protein